MSTLEKSIESKEKRFVAFTSVIAAILLTLMKLIVGLMTGSLGILSEALHSGLDLIAAIMTLFAVRISDKPADHDHNFGHGKIENISALGETLLLLITCVWIIYEAVHRLMTGEVEIIVTYWSYAVIIISIIIDFSRSRALMKAAKKYNSHALEADALHFSTDILSSFVVLLGLVAVQFNFHAADAIAALFVALIVIYISYKMGKKSVDVLTDKAPLETVKLVNEILAKVDGVIQYHDLKIKSMGPSTFIAATIHVDPHLTIQEAHTIAENAEAHIKAQIKNCTIHIHEEPDE